MHGISESFDCKIFVERKRINFYFGGDINVLGKKEKLDTDFLTWVCIKEGILSYF